MVYLKVLVACCITQLQLLPVESAPLGATDCSGYPSKEECQDDSSIALDCVWVPQTPGVEDEAMFKCAARGCDTYTAAGDVEGAECKANKACTFDAATMYCVTKGTQPPCGLYYADPADGQKCPARCDYNDDAEACVEKGAKISCGQIADKNRCNFDSDCTFNKEISKCWETGVDIPCAEYEYFARDMCPGYCKWITTNGGAQGNNGICVEADQEAPCSSFTFDDTNGYDCPKDRCKWYPLPINECVGAEREVPCSELPCDSCAAMGRCQYFDASDGGTHSEGDCDICLSGKDDCVSDPLPRCAAGPDDDKMDPDDNGQACSTFAGEGVYECPEPRCFVEEGDMSGCGSDPSDGATCKPAVCEDLIFDPTNCKKVKPAGSCSFDDETGVCYDATKTFPCGLLDDESDCADTPKKECSWLKSDVGEADGGFCYPTGGHVSCHKYIDPTDCPSTCKWNGNADKCFERDEKIECKAYGNEGTCPAEENCEWKNGLCWEQGKPIACADFCEPGQCLGSGFCAYNDKEFYCEPCPASGCIPMKDCETYKTQETCPSAICEFIFDDVSHGAIMEKGNCVDKQCPEITDEITCKAHAVTPLCAWDGYLCEVEGFHAPCDKYWNSAGCLAGDKCKWDAVEMSCFESAGRVSCDKYTEDECGKGDAAHCHVVGWECEFRTDLEPATPPPLPGKGDGTGNERWSKCTPAMYDNLRPKLESSEDECIDYGIKVAESRERRTGDLNGSATEKQLLCLAYFLSEAPSPSTVAEACPCLWFYAEEVSPGTDHWMQIAC